MCYGPGVKRVARTDQRCCEIESAAEAEAVLRTKLGEFTRLEANLARAMAEVEKKRSYLLAGFRTVRQWAEAQGYGPRLVSQLLELGRSLLVSPRLEEKVLAGKVCPESAAHVGRVLRDKAVQKAGVDETEWLDRAESMPPRQLRDAAIAEIEEAHQQETTVAVHMRLTRTARKDLQKVRLLISRGRRVPATEGEAVGASARCYLEHHDPARKPLPARRSGTTASGPDRRIPPRVVAQLERRSRGVCELCGERRATEKIHLHVPHAQGGSREVDNLAHACHQCHTLFDAGYFELRGRDPQGRPVWDVHPERLDELRERSPPYLVA